MFIAAVWIVNGFLWSWYFLLIACLLWLVDKISSLKISHTEKIKALNHQIETYLEKDLEIQKTHKIYRGLMKSLNSNSFLHIFRPNISQIACFRVQKSNLYLENSSDFIWSYSILDKNILDNLEKDPEQNIKIKINGDEKFNNFFIRTTFRNQPYLFVFISNKTINPLAVLYLKKLLNLVTHRISRVIGIERTIKLENRKMLQEFRAKHFQIQNAEKVMHFIRNRFNTLDNFIEMSKDNIAGNMNAEGLKVYATELERLERNYKILMERAKSILDKSDKPFSATLTNEKSINFIFNLIREIWLDFFPIFDPIIDEFFTKSTKATTKINPDGFYIVVLDWISNMRKYSATEKTISFNATEDFFVITFVNQFRSASKEEVENLMSDFNSVDRDKILQRTSHGVSIMKSIIEEMALKAKIEIENNYLKLVLSLKKS